MSGYQLAVCDPSHTQGGWGTELNIKSTEFSGVLGAVVEFLQIYIFLCGCFIFLYILVYICIFFVSFCIYLGFIVHVKLID